MILVPLISSTGGHSLGDDLVVGGGVIFGVYELSLTKISQSDCPVSIPYQQRLSYQNPPSLIPIQLFKISASPVLMPSLFPLAYVFLSGSFHSAAPEPGSGRDGPEHTHMWPSIPCTIFLYGSIYFLSFCLCLLLRHPVH